MASEPLAMDTPFTSLDLGTAAHRPRLDSSCTWGEQCDTVKSGEVWSQKGVNVNPVFVIQFSSVQSLSRVRLFATP